MSWGTKRQRFIEVMLGALAAAFLAVVMIAVFYRTPSCVDHALNGGEQGIDCGGPCPFLCSSTETPPAVRFVRAVHPQPGRTDVIAYIDNSNSNGEAQDAAYTLDLYDGSENLVTQKTGMVNIPPSSTAPLYIPNAYDGGHTVSQAFLTIATSSITWVRAVGKPIVPIPGNIQTTPSQTPRITAVLQNPVASVLSNITEVATVFDSSGNAIDASQTVVQSLPAQGTAQVVFTWNQPFPELPARIEILPAFGP